MMRGVSCMMLAHHAEPHVACDAAGTSHLSGLWSCFRDRWGRLGGRHCGARSSISMRSETDWRWSPGAWRATGCETSGLVKPDSTAYMSPAAVHPDFITGMQQAEDCALTRALA